MAETYARATVIPQAKGYSEAGASVTKRALKGFDAVSGSPNEDINYNNARLRQRSRMLYMSSPLATSAIKTNRTHVIGTGLQLKSSIDADALGLTAETAKAWQLATESEFALWAEKKTNCDATGINNFASMQQLAMTSWLLSGDVFALIKRRKTTPLNPYSLRLHIIEADRISTPLSGTSAMIMPIITDGVNLENKNRIYDGVEVENDGDIRGYWIRNTYPGQIVAPVTEWARVEAYGAKTGLPNILHIMNSERPEQYRGVPFLAPIIEVLLQIRRFTESELVAAVVQSFFTAFIETQTDPTLIPLNEVGSGDVFAGEISGTLADAGNTPRNPNEYNMGPGTVEHLQPGEKVTLAAPNIPAASFEMFIKTMSKLVGAALEQPYDVLVKEFNSSYSAARGALLEAWEAFKMYRAWFRDDFCQPVYELWLSEAVALGRVKAPGFFTDPRVRAAWSGAQWIGPTQSQLDPVKEAKAAIMQVDRGFKTHEQITREIGGGDWQQNVAQLELENNQLREAGGGTYMAALETETDTEPAE